MFEIVIKKVVLIVEPTKSALDRAFKVMKKPNKKYSGVSILSFPDFETLGRVITGARLELLSIIRKKKPKSIQELARLVGRDFKNVYQDVVLLEEFGFIESKPRRRGQASAPIVKYEEIVLAA